MDEDAEQQLTAELSNNAETLGQQLDGTTGSSPVSQHQRRSLASLLSIKRETRRPKTPSVVVTDETTHLVIHSLISNYCHINLNFSTSAVGINVHPCRKNQSQFQKQE